MSPALDLDTVDMLRTSLRAVLTDDRDAPLAEQLDELGWDEVVAADPATAMRVLFETKGETLSGADALGLELNRALASASAVAGTSPEAMVVALPSPFGLTVLDGDVLSVTALVGSTPPSGSTMAVPVSDGRFALVPEAALERQRLIGTDEALGMIRLDGGVPLDDVGWLDRTVWHGIEGRARGLLASELVGVARHVLADAVRYTTERVQYDKPIGVFQALQHRAAQAHSLVTGAAHLAEEAVGTDDAWTAMVAKCLAGRAAETACTHAQQFYGAIGFTFEHELHLSLRRTYALDALLGDWRSLERKIGDHLQSSGAVPAIGTL